MRNVFKSNKLFVVMFAVLVGITLVRGVESVSREFSVGAYPRLTLDAGPARVKVELGDDDKIEVYAEMPGSDLYTLECSQDGNRVKLSLKPRGALGWLLQPISMVTEECYIQVKVPAACNVILDTWGGRMEVRGVEGEIRARSGSEVIRLFRTFFQASQVVDST